MSFKKPFVVVNAHANRGRTGTLWPEISKHLTEVFGEFTSVFTEGPGHATQAVRSALREGENFIIAVGGDGTVNEVVNGFFDSGQAIVPEAELGLILKGSGSDFGRTYGAQKSLRNMVEHVAASQPRLFDLCLARYQKEEGGEEQRFFLNAAACGLGGAAARTVNRQSLPRFLPGTLSYLVASLLNGLLFRNQEVEITTDKSPVKSSAKTEKINTLAICNGQYFGGGMWIAPMADPRDGLLDLVEIGNVNTWDLLTNLPRLYRGTHLAHRKVKASQITQLSLSPVQKDKPLLLNIDGESVGVLPAHFQIVPASIKIRI